MTHRDLATLIIFALFLLFLLFRGAGRSILGMLKLMFSGIVTIICTPYLVYSLLLISAADRLDIWNSDMLKDTVLTVLLIGLPMVFRAIGIRSGGLLFQQTMNETLGLSAFMAFYINLSSLSILWEFVLQLTIFIIAMISAVAKIQRSSELALIKLLDQIMIFIGLIYLVSTTMTLFHHWNEFDRSLALRTLAFSIWFPLFLIPYIYAFAFLMQCSSVFGMLSLSNGGVRPKLRIRFALFCGLRFSIHRASAFDGDWRNEIGPLKSFREALDVMARFRGGLETEI